MTLLWGPGLKPAVERGGTGGRRARCPPASRVYMGVTGENCGAGVPLRKTREKPPVPGEAAVYMKSIGWPVLDLVPWPARGPCLSSARTDPDEAHLSTQEAQARPHPRVSRAHAHARRAGRAEAAQGQGPQAAHPVVGWPIVRVVSAAGCRGAASSSGSTAKAVLTRVAILLSTRSRERMGTGRLDSASRSGASSAARWSETA